VDVATGRRAERAAGHDHRRRDDSVGPERLCPRDEQYVKDTFNTYYVDGRFPVAFAAGFTLALAAQYYGQDAVGSKQLGAFSTWGLASPAC